MRSGRILHKIDLFLPRESQSRGAAGEASVFSPVVGSVAAQKPVETTDGPPKACSSTYTRLGSPLAISGERDAPRWL